MARLLGLFRNSLGRTTIGRTALERASQARTSAQLSAVYGLSALSGPYAAAPVVARSYTLPTVARAHGTLPRAAHAVANAAACRAVAAVARPAARAVRVYRDTSHIVMVGTIADICRKLDQAVGERFIQIAD